MKISNCPTCQTEVKFGQQLCISCGTLIYWKKQDDTKVAVERRAPLNFPQKAELVLNVFGRELKNDSSPVVREYFPRERVVAIAMEDGYIALEKGGWIHASTVLLFGRLHQIRVIDPTLATPVINVLDSPRWGVSPDECGQVIDVVKVGEMVEVWEVIPGWLRIAAGTGWVSSIWFDSESVEKLT